MVESITKITVTPEATEPTRNGSLVSIDSKNGFEPLFLKPEEGLQNKGSKPSLFCSVSNNHADRRLHKAT